MVQTLLSLDLKTLIIPGIFAFGILFAEPFFLSLRLFFLIPKETGVSKRDLRNLYFKAQLLSHFSASALGDLYRLKTLGSIPRKTEITVPDRIQYLAIERISESLTLPLVGVLFTDFSTIKKMIPISFSAPIAGVLGVLALGIWLRSGKKTNPHFSLSKVSLKTLIMVLSLSALGWIMDLLALSALTHQDHIPLSELIIALIVVSMSSIPPLPWGRWGLFEGILGATLHQSGIPIDRALALATVFHILMVLPFCLITAFNWIRNRLKKKETSLS
jgi:hypothetical protein